MKFQSEEAVIAAVADADIVVVNMVPFTARVIGSLTNCKRIIRHGAGYDNIDVAACTAARIPLAYCPDYCMDEVAEQAIALMFACARQVPQSRKILDDSMAAVKWDFSPLEKCYRMAGKVLGIIGCGRIGSAVFHKMRHFGFNEILVCDPYLPERNVKRLGVTVTDVDGNSFLDWTSGVLVTNVGHAHPHLVKALQEASGRLLNNYECPSRGRVLAAEKLVEALPPHMQKCFFLSTGSETVEAAIRVMKRKSGNFEIVGFHGGFHGRTYAAASVGGLAGPKRGYGPAMATCVRVPFPYFYRCPFGSKTEDECADKHIEVLDDTVRANSVGSLAGLIVEPYQDAAGFIFPPRK